MKIRARPMPFAHLKLNSFERTLQRFPFSPFAPRSGILKG